MKSVGSFHCPVTTGWINNGGRPWYIPFLLMGIILLLTSPCQPLFAQQSKPSDQTVIIHPGLQSAREAAAEDHSLILLILTTHQCRNCDRLARETLALSSFNDQAGLLHLVTININEQQRYASDYQVRKVPDLILLTPEGEIIQRAQGFMDVESLLEFLSTGRQAHSENKWLTSDNETLPVSQHDTAELIGLLGSPKPLLRARAAQILAKSGRETKVSGLIDALSHPYLGNRVGAWALLHNWAPEAPDFDPWAEAPKRAAQREQVASWWQQTQKLPDPSEAPNRLDLSELRSAEEAIAVIEHNDISRLATAAAKLRGMGSSCLDLLRRAIEKNSMAGEHHTVRMLEGIRWAILVPDDLEKIIRVRNALAWGTSEERQEAVERLGKGGNESIAPLTELVNDPDPLIRESVAHALAKLTDTRSLESLAGLLGSADPNTRMVAAQELGKTKKAQAGKYLAPLIGDPDELVACTAIAALEECKAKDRSKELLAALTDPRWRVRAAAAETLGKLEIHGAVSGLTQLLGDTDAFVLRSALEALMILKGLPSVDTLLPLYEEYPELTSMLTTAVLTQSGQTPGNTFTHIYSRSKPATRRDIIITLSKELDEKKAADVQWTPFLQQVITDSDENRTLLPMLMEKISPVITAPFINRLLSDPQEQIREQGCWLVIMITAHHWGSSDLTKSLDFGILLREHGNDSQPPLDPNDASAPIISRQNILEFHRQWHNSLTPLVRENPSLVNTLAHWVTGDGLDGQDQLETILKDHDKGEGQELLADKHLAVVLLKRLTWPEGRSLLEQIRRFPLFFAAILQERVIASSPEVVSQLNKPEVIHSLFTGALDSDTKEIISSVIGNKRALLYLAQESDSNRLIIEQLLKSEQEWAKTLGVFCLAYFNDSAARVELKSALKEFDPWVRYAAIQGIITHGLDQQMREELLSPLLDDLTPEVVHLAAVGLLDPALSELLQPDDVFSTYRYNTLSIEKSFDYGLMATSDPRPFTPIARKPLFLKTLNKLLQDPARFSTDQLHIFSILLAQYGETQALAETVAQWKTQKDDNLADILQIAPLFSDNAEYLEPLRGRIQGMNDSYELRNVLKFLRGAPGSGARSLRREINQRINTSESP